jgi:hypothetical protein
MQQASVGGLGRVILSSRERPILAEPMGNGLRGVTLRFAHEVRSEAEYFNEIPEIRLPRRESSGQRHGHLRRPQVLARAATGPTNPLGALPSGIGRVFGEGLRAQILALNVLVLHEVGHCP